MNVLILGSGGREHALAWKISQSQLLDRLYIAPGNAGTALCGTNLPVRADDFAAVRQAVLSYAIDMVVVGPEDPLVKGIHDYFLSDEDLKNVMVIGPVKRAAMLEGSKDFAKAFMKRQNIPTADFQTFYKSELPQALEYLRTLNPPYVLKADGLAAGKGVIICHDIREAENELKSMLGTTKFGAAGDKVVIEEFLSGIEVSVFILTDGRSYVLLPEAKDYKRIGEGDTGLNTGGMGSISPVPFADKSFMDKVREQIIDRTLFGLRREGIDYKGFMFFGLMNVEGDPYVIEYNARLGDPESESIMPRITSDLLELLVATGNNQLHEKKIEISEGYSVAVMLVSGGYPGDYRKGLPVTGVEQVKDSIIFHAGTKQTENGSVITNGGRVLATVSLAKNLEEALRLSYDSASKIHFDDSYYRKDLGLDLMKFINVKP